jgi:hypothetical protein
MATIDAASRKTVNVVSRTHTQDADGNKTETETAVQTGIYADIQPWEGNVAQVPSGAISNPTHMIFTEVNYTNIEQYHVFVYGSLEYEVVFVYDYAGEHYYLARKL